MRKQDIWRHLKPTIQYRWPLLREQNPLKILKPKSVIKTIRMKRNFLKKVFNLLVVLCLCYSLPADAQLYSEESTFKINYLWMIQIGKLIVKREPYILNEEDIYQISARYEPAGWMSFIYRWKGKFFSYIDHDGFLPLRYEEFISYPFHDDVNSVLIYDQDKKIVYIDRNGEKETKAILDHTLDPLSAL